jgi:hypothetical protein
MRGSNASNIACGGAGAYNGGRRSAGCPGRQPALRQQRLQHHPLGQQPDRFRQGAGLGDEAQVHIVVSATALCINPGSNHPKAVNKESVSAEGDFPVQNGKAEFSLTLTATFQPECSPPITVAFTNVTVTDETNGISRSFSGTF